MAFVMLDNKNWCKGVYHDGELHFSELPSDLSKTWRFSKPLEDEDVEYAYLYCGGKGIDEVCPEGLRESWESAFRKLTAYHKSFVHAKINLAENCFFDLVPQQFLKDFCKVKSQIIDSVIEQFPKPKNYDFLLELDKLTQDISEQKINLNMDSLKREMHDVRARALAKKLNKVKPYVNYNIFGTKTGRLTTNKESFPILNLDSKYKNIVRPNNEAFVELDYNSAELRVLLSLAGQTQPKEDIHSWNAKKFNLTREEAKKEIFAWLYGSTKIDSSKYESFFNLEKIKKSFFDGKNVCNIYDRKIKSDEFHCLNHIIQSTTNDMFLRQVILINKIFKSKKSFIAFTVHDSVVIDLAKEDKELLTNVIRQFGETDLGHFPVNVSIGKDYGTLRKIQCL